VCSGTQHQRRCPGLHRPAAIGVQCQLIARDGMFFHRVDEQGLEAGSALGVLQPPGG